MRYETILFLTFNCRNQEAIILKLILLRMLIMLIIMHKEPLKLLLTIVGKRIQLGSILHFKKKEELMYTLAFIVQLYIEEGA